jgi:hypothetical protein
MPSQVEVFKRLFENDLPETAVVRERVTELLRRDTFDEDCVEFHRFYIQLGLDFAFCWASAHSGGDSELAQRKYTDIVEQTDIEHLYENVPSDVPPTPRKQ